MVSPSLSILVLGIQLVQTMLISVLLYLFSRVFERDPLHYWGWSWAGLSVYYTTLLLPRLITVSPAAIMGFALIGSAASLLSGLWLMLGTRRFVGLNVERLPLWTFGTITLSLVIVFVSKSLESPILQNDGAWMMRCAIVGCAYLASCWLLLVRGGRSTIGRSLLVGSFLMYGIQLLHYLFLVTGDWMANALTRSSTAPWGVLDISLQAIMGLGTIVWLLEREHEHVLNTTQKLQQLSCFDPITRLPNRVLFQESVAATLRQADTTDQIVAMMVVNPDKFGRINKVFGHLDGDEILRRIAGRVESVLQAGDSLARLEGDQFVVVAPIGDRSEANECAGRILDRLREPFLISDSQLFLTASIGAALYPEDGRDVKMLLRSCELSLERSKQLGGDQVRFFNLDMSSVAMQKQTFETSFRRALAEDQFDLHYQPIRSLATGRLKAVEALLRWNHPIDGLLPPGQFLREAERAGLGGNLVPWVLDRACATAVELQQRIPGLRMAVNIDAPTFQRSDFQKTVLETLKRHGLRPECLELELTESMAIREPDMGLTTIRKLRRFGVRVALDDFGTGFSSLGYLREFPIDTLKIDRSFIRELGQSSGAGAIVEAVVTLARRLNLGLVAEGVETEIQRKMLSDLGCDLAQGYLFSRPWESESSFF